MKADSWRRKPHNEPTDDCLERFRGNTILNFNTLFSIGICVVGLLNAQTGLKWIASHYAANSMALEQELKQDVYTL